jgi:hypothetical protein
MEPEKQIAWDMYFASVTSMQYHPRATLNGAKVRTIEECAKVADEMLVERKKRNNNEH